MWFFICIDLSEVYLNNNEDEKDFIDESVNVAKDNEDEYDLAYTYFSKSRFFINQPMVFSVSLH